MMKYTTIKLNDYSFEQVNKLVGKYGFDSRTDVVKTALNEFFEKFPETKVRLPEIRTMVN